MTLSHVLRKECELGLLTLDAYWQEGREQKKEGNKEERKLIFSSDYVNIVSFIVSIRV